MSAVAPEIWLRIVAACDRIARIDDPVARDAAIRHAADGDGALETEIRSLLAWDPGDDDEPPSDDAGEPAAPERIGPLRVVRWLGSGASGDVYLARQPQPRRLVAVKLLRRIETADDPASRRRVEAEADMLARIRHPGVAPIHTCGSYDTPAGPRRYLVMEYVDGEPITSYARRRELDDDAVVALLLHACDPVSHVHRLGIIHRDLKPANVLVVPPETSGAAETGVAGAATAGATAAGAAVDEAARETAGATAGASVAANGSAPGPTSKRTPASPSRRAGPRVRVLDFGGATMLDTMATSPHADVAERSDGAPISPSPSASFSPASSPSPSSSPSPATPTSNGTPADPPLVETVRWASSPHLASDSVTIGSSEVRGTIGYLAPEVLDRHDVAAAPNQDVYALGIMLRDMLLGRDEPDVPSGSLVEQIAAVRRTAVPIRTERPDLDADLAIIVDAATATDPAVRYATVEALADDLRAWQRGMPISRRAGSRVYVARRFVQRHRVGTALVGLAILGVVAGYVGITASLAAERQRNAELKQAAIDRVEGAISIVESLGRYTGVSADVDRYLQRLCHDLAAEFVAPWDPSSVQAPELRAVAVALDARFRPAMVMRPAQPIGSPLDSDARLRAAMADAFEAYSGTRLARGEAEAALDLRLRVLQLREQVVAAAPDDLTAARDHARGIVLVGDALAQTDLPMADAVQEWCYRRALNLNRALVERAPNDLPMRDDLAWSVHRMAAMSFIWGREDAARRFSDEHHAVLKEIERQLERFEGHPAVQATRARHLEHGWGDHHLLASKLAPGRLESLGHLDEGIARLRRLVQREPRVGTYSALLVSSLIRRAQQTIEWAEEEATPSDRAAVAADIDGWLREAEELARHRLRTDREDPAIRSQIVRVLFMQADRAIEHGWWPQTLSLYEQIHALLEESGRLGPETRIRIGLGRVNCYQGEAAQAIATNASPAACHAVTDALTILEDLSETTTVLSRDDGRQALERIAEVTQRVGDEGLIARVSRLQGRAASRR